MEAYGGVDVLIHVFLTSALLGGEWSASRPGCFTPAERAPGTHWIGGWVDPRAGLDDVEKRTFLTLPGLELRHLGRPASSQSLNRLHYHGSPFWPGMCAIRRFEIRVLKHRKIISVHLFVQPGLKTGIGERAAGAESFLFTSKHRCSNG
jgi:hypothetical protein